MGIPGIDIVDEEGLPADLMCAVKLTLCQLARVTSRAVAYPLAKRNAEYCISTEIIMYVILCDIMLNLCTVNPLVIDLWRTYSDCLHNFTYYFTYYMYHIAHNSMGLRRRAPAPIIADPEGPPLNLV